MQFADNQLRNLIKITKVRKGSNYTNHSDVLNRRLCLQQPAPAFGLTHGCVTMLSDSQAGSEISYFVLIL